jgi:GTP diphosphokinase / guanosine-3',5'-bis(diphosphate) 3'-diphosphatase
MTTPISIPADDIAITAPSSATVSDSLTYNCDIPDWLQQCLDEDENFEAVGDLDATAERLQQRVLIKNAFQFAYDLLHLSPDRRSGIVARFRWWRGDDCSGIFA